MSNEWNSDMESKPARHASVYKGMCDSLNTDKSAVWGHIYKFPKEWDWQDKETKSEGNTILDPMAHGKKRVELAEMLSAP